MLSEKTYRSPTLAFLGAVLGVICQSASAAPAAKTTTYKVGTSTFTGSSKTICVIEGQWADGLPVRYEAWDRCSAMKVRRVTAKQYVGSPSLGAYDDFEITDIPPGSDVLEVGNEHSVILLFRDRKGVMREIMIRD